MTKLVADRNSHQEVYVQRQNKIVATVNIIVSSSMPTTERTTDERMTKLTTAFIKTTADIVYVG